MASASKAPNAASQPTEQDLVNQFNSRRNELKSLLTKVDELSRDAEEHAAVITTLKEAQAKDPNRKCFRMIGGVLVQRAVKEILPSLETNLQGIKQVTEQLAKQYKQKEVELSTFQRQHNIQIRS